MRLHLGPEIHHLLYADDLQIYIQVPPESFSDGIISISSAARSISEWAQQVSLHLNPTKTKAIYFGGSFFIDCIDKQNYPGVPMGPETIVPFVKEIKNLGVILDSKLSWEPHISLISKKVNRILYTLRFIRHCTTETLRMKLVQALVVPHLDYCSVVYLDCPKKLKERIQRLSNSCLRYVFGVRKDVHVTPYREKIGWLSSNHRRLYFIAILMYKILRLRQPDYLEDFFVKYTPKQTARGDLLIKELSLPDQSKWHGDRSFQIQGIKAWNSLPSKIRFLPSLSSFKSALLIHLKTTAHTFDGSVF